MKGKHSQADSASPNLLCAEGKPDLEKLWTEVNTEARRISETEERLGALMEDVLLHPEAALAEALGAEDEREQENGNTEFSGETTIRKKPALLNKLAREVTLMQSIIVMSIGVLDECLNVQKKARGQKNWKIAQSKVANRGSDTATSQAG